MDIRFIVCFLTMLMSFHQLKSSSGQEGTVQPRGKLIMIGGGLGVSNQQVFLELIEAAGGTEKANFVLLPAASLSLESARLFRDELAEFGLKAEQVEILNVMRANAAQAAHDPANVQKVEQATAVYMTGGDQVRLVQTLTSADGSDTPLLSAMRRLWERGGLIAGTSAGASAQSAQMLAASGLPNMLVDEGLDALDYGLTSDAVARGILVTRGLGFLQHGIIDQHFLQYRGRLARLSRVCLERKLPFGIGIDKNSAIRVDPDGTIKVISGTAIVVMADKATSIANPAGFYLNQIRIALLSTGDVFHPMQSTFTIHPSKHPIVKQDLSFDGGFLITDIGAGFAVSSALIGGLAENTQSVQEGIVLQYHDATSHGYRYRFMKDSASQAFHASTLDGSLYSLLNIQLDISSIANGLNDSLAQQPVDIGDLPHAMRQSISAVAFRGLLPTDSKLQFRPDDELTRREFALACVRSVHLTASPENQPMVRDVSGADINEIQQALAANFVSLDENNRFFPHQPIARQDVEKGLQKLASLCVTTPSIAFQKSMTELSDSNERSVSRSQFATILAGLLLPQWLEP